MKLLLPSAPRMPVQVQNQRALRMLFADERFSQQTVDAGGPGEIDGLLQLNCDDLADCGNVQMEKPISFGANLNSLRGG